MTTIDDQLHKAIGESGLSLRGLAKAAGIDAATLIRFNNGDRDIRLKTAAALAKVLGLELQPIKKPRRSSKK